MTHICQKERRERKGKEKTSEKEKEKEKKAERSTVKMYYWNVALSEHCEDVPLPGNMIWFMLVDPNAATSCSRDEKEEKKEPSVEEEEKKDVVATVDPYIEYAIPTKKRKRKRKEV